MIKKTLTLVLLLGMSQEIVCAAKAHPKQKVVDEIIDWYRYLDAANSVIQKDIGELFKVLYYKASVEDVVKPLATKKQSATYDKTYEKFGINADEIKKFLESSINDAQSMLSKSMPLANSGDNKLINLLPTTRQQEFIAALTNLNSLQGRANFNKFLETADRMLQAKIGDLFKSIYYRESIEQSIRNSEENLGGTVPRESTEETIDHVYQLFGNNAQEIKKMLEESFRNAQAMLVESLAPYKEALGYDTFTVEMIKHQPKGLHGFLPPVKSKKYEKTQEETRNALQMMAAMNQLREMQQMQMLENLLANVAVTDPSIATTLQGGGKAPSESNPDAEIINTLDSNIKDLERQIRQKGEDKELMARLEESRQIRADLIAASKAKAPTAAAATARVTEMTEEQAEVFENILNIKREISDIEKDIKTKDARYEELRKIAFASDANFEAIRTASAEMDAIETEIATLKKSIEEKKEVIAQLEAMQ